MPNRDLDTNVRDVVVAAARGLVSACPLIGGLVAEVVNVSIPNQKLDRVVDYLRLLEQRVSALDAELGRVGESLCDEQGVDLFEEGVVQAARALSDDRRRRIANLVARSLTQDELKYAESRKLLNLLREVTDPELLLLVFYSHPLTIGSQYHRELVEKHPEILLPASRTIGIPQEEIDRSALRDSYVNTLVRLGLVREEGKEHSLTPLGELLLRYIEQDEDGQE